MNQYQVIPTSPDAFYTEIVTLEGVDFQLSFQYSQRESCYYMSIATPDGTDLLNGVKLVANISLIGKYAYDGLPKGDFICLANGGSPDPPPQLGQIGADSLPFTLFYVPSQLLPGGTGP